MTESIETLIYFNLFAEIIDGQLVSMISEELLKKLNNPCHTVAAAARDQDQACPCQAAPATTGCPAWTAPPAVRRAVFQHHISTAV